MNKKYTDIAIDYTTKLLSIDSPTGFTGHVTAYLMELLKEMGFEPCQTRKGCVVVELGGKGNPIVMAAHVDTLGLMVRSIQENGKLSFTRIGGPSFNAVETENVKLYTRDGKIYTGVVELSNASIHVNHELDETKRDDRSLEILLDENVHTRQDVEKLGISVGDYICLDPRTRIFPNGTIRSRFLDDKLSAGMLLTYAQAVSDGACHPKRRTTLFFSVYEEVGHGASAGIPSDTEDLLVVDMGCVGKDIICTEEQVSICAKDSGGPYDYNMTTELIQCAEKHNVNYAVDVYPYYGSDAGAALKAGMDIRYALIGAGVYASHGYERSHRNGVANTLSLISSYLEED